MAVIYILLSSIMFTNTIAYAPYGEYIQIPYFLKYIIAVSVFILSFGRSLLNNKFVIKVSFIKDILFFSIPIFIYIASLGIANLYYGLYSFEYISRAMSNVICNAAIILGVIGAVNVFGRKAIEYSYYGLILSTTINVVVTSYYYGLVNVMEALFNIIKIVDFSYAPGSLMSNIGYSLEVADATFAYGFFLLYYFLFDKLNRKRLFFICMALIGIFLGLKRIEIIAIFLTILFYFFIVRNSKRLSKRKMSILTIIVILVFFVYLIIFKYYVGIFSVLDYNRVTLYTILGNLFDLSPAYIGKGFGYVNKWLSEIHNLFYITTESHSDLVRLYIELGCVGFIFLVVYYFKLLPNYLNRRNGLAAKVSICFSVYLFITYFIDNTFLLFATQFCYMLIPISIFMQKEKKYQSEEIYSRDGRSLRINDFNIAR